MYKKLEAAIKRFEGWKNIDLIKIGESTLGQPIFCVHVGEYLGNQIVLDAGIHAREYICSYLLIELIKHIRDKNFLGGFYFIPICNPDGVRISMEGISWIGDKKLKTILSVINNYSLDFSMWKANALGVDLNVNFDADWGGGSQNVFSVAPENFVGYYPNSEKENRILIDYINKINPQAYLSFHSKGEVIYYGFSGISENHLTRDFNLAKKISLINGYDVVQTKQSTGAFSDWISREKHIPSLTIEIGSDNLKHPIDVSELPFVFDKNKDVPLIAMEFLSTLTNYN